MMMLGGGKQHGQYFMANNAIDASSVQTLSEIRREDRRRGGPQIPVVPWQPSNAQMMTALQVSGISFVVHSLNT
jgi:hypothetical protein